MRVMLSVCKSCYVTMSILAGNFCDSYQFFVSEVGKLVVVDDIKPSRIDGAIVSTMLVYTLFVLMPNVVLCCVVYCLVLCLVL